ncbi:cysteine--tRNA ligase [Moraxella osloensis]|uniref:Cysteine--tRNA ligase n=1 Tax=Faucicola osloensis TaxID=34062 RepID=A0A378QAT2_FAUOS|nr:cysteine--tRNA ligase [Moraxella osloensis]AME00487.1 cysteine--tRNA ligase [Moraxella osloensis]OBX54551.1 cysteine--tRNA ligase [Moraxella osloensis]QPT41923.1 cysteine--tRNA ligase [Moraxella osloensis]STY97524.1 Cysteine--tRNA ligase [Moraxella osloensis]
MTQLTQPMPITIYDSMSGQKRPFTPLEAGKVGMYVCGMTVYDYCHIGHARVMVGFDVVVRWLRHMGYDVNYVRNITDIDDKIINRAKDNGESIYQLTDRFIKAMHEDADNLGCERPNSEPKATDFIPQMQHLIQTLESKKLAYQGATGDVYYAVENFAEYGKLSKRRLADMQAGASERVNVETDKKNPFDFVLWKSAKQTEPSETKWQSPWGVGRPGWHIECSAMSTCCLGDTFDIHGGGHDLQFPHHENEIAQSEGATGKTYANNWMHVGFINVDGEKMSKSLGNFFTIRDVMGQFHPETIRFFILSSHYRSPVNFSDSALKEAQTSLTRLYQALKSVESLTQPAGKIDKTPFETPFNQAMGDDFNSAGAVSVLFSLAREINKAVNLETDEGNAQALALATLLKDLAQPLNILQLNPTDFLQARVGEADGLSDADIQAQIDARKQAKADKDFAKADQIRHDLKAQGIELEDGKNGTTWRRV